MSLLTDRHYPPIKKLIGIIAISLPVVLYLGGQWVFETDQQATFSLYYFTPMRDVFVGILCILGTLLYLDKNHKLYGTSAGLCALVTALLPTSPTVVAATLTSKLHSLSAVVFFLSLALICLIVFARTSQYPRYRRIYQYCGCTIGLMVLSFIALKLSTMTELAYQAKIPFYLQCIATWAFGIAWLTRSIEENSNK